MLVDRYEAEDVFARVPRMAERIDPVLSRLDQLLDDDQLYQRVRTDFGKRYLCWLLEASAEKMEGLISSVTSYLNASHARKA